MGDPFSVSSEDGIGLGDGGDGLQGVAGELFADFGERGTLRISQSKPCRKMSSQRFCFQLPNTRSATVAVGFTIQVT